MAILSDVDITEFSEPGIFNYTTLLLSEEQDALYVGAREAIFKLSKNNITRRNDKVWLIKRFALLYFIFFKQASNVFIFVIKLYF